MTKLVERVVDRCPTSLSPIAIHQQIVRRPMESRSKSRAASVLVAACWPIQGPATGTGTPSRGVRWSAAQPIASTTDRAYDTNLT
jgi:hypothetical protein